MSRWPDPLTRVLDKVRIAGDCWLIDTFLSDDGYARVWIGKRRTCAHRVTYEGFVGPIPEGMEIDHLCRVRNCVNPDHLEAVTTAENLRRSNAWAGVNSRKTQCPAGHEYDRVDANGHRHCRACTAARQREHRARKQHAVTAEVSAIVP